MADMDDLDGLDATTQQAISEQLQAAWQRVNAARAHTEELFAIPGVASVGEATDIEVDDPGTAHAVVSLLIEYVPTLEDAEVAALRQAVREVVGGAVGITFRAQELRSKGVHRRGVRVRPPMSRLDLAAQLHRIPGVGSVEVATIHCGRGVPRAYHYAILATRSETSEDARHAIKAQAEKLLGPYATVEVYDRELPGSVGEFVTAVSGTDRYATSAAQPWPESVDTIKKALIAAGPGVHLPFHVLEAPCSVSVRGDDVIVVPADNVPITFSVGPAANGGSIVEARRPSDGQNAAMRWLTAVWLGSVIGDCLTRGLLGHDTGVEL